MDGQYAICAKRKRRMAEMASARQKERNKSMNKKQIYLPIDAKH